MKHLNGLIDEATVVVDKFAESDPEQVRWLAQIRESSEGTRVSVVATPWDQSLANRVPLDLGAAAGSTLDAKLAMAEVVLHGADRADRRRQGLPEDETEDCGDGQHGPAESPRWLSEPLPPAAGLDSAHSEPDTPGVRILAVPPAADSPAAGPVTATGAPDTPDAEPDAPDVPIIPAQRAADSPAAGPVTAAAAPDTPDAPDVRIIPAQRAADSPAAGPVTAAAAPDTPDGWPDTPNVRIIPVRTESDSTDTEPTVLQTITARRSAVALTWTDDVARVPRGWDRLTHIPRADQSPASLAACRRVTKLLADLVTVCNRRRCLRLAQRGQRPSDKPVGDHGGLLVCAPGVSSIRGRHVSRVRGGVWTGPRVTTAPVKALAAADEGQGGGTPQRRTRAHR